MYDLRFVYCGQDKQAAEAANVPGTRLFVGQNYGDVLTRAAVEVAEVKVPPRFVSPLSPKP